LATPSAVESYLQDFHQRIVGATTAAFGVIPATIDGATYASSYHLLSSVIPESSEPLTVLDLACGDGHLLGLLAARKQAGLTLIGADMSQGELDAARVKLPSEIALLNERAQHLSLADDSTDFVLSHMAMMLMDDIDQVLAETRRILRPAGMLASVVGRTFLLGEVMQIYIPLLQAIAKDDAPPPLRFGDSRMHSTTAGWETLLAPYFTEVRCIDVNLEWHPRPAELWESLSQTYDVDRLSPQAQSTLRVRFLEALSDIQENDGTISTGWGLRFVSGRKA